MKRLLTLLLMLSAWPAFGQTLPPGISPEIIEEFQNLPPSQQQALARQYGITLPSTTSGASAPADGQLSLPGDAIVPAQPIDTSDAANLIDPLSNTGDTASEVIISRYGQSLFDQTVSTFAPTDDALVEESYRLGVGD